MFKGLSVGLSTLLLAAAFAASPSTAMANVHTYGSHYTCVDEYLDPNNNGYYTSQMCSNSYAKQYVAYEWGYPRAWNGEGTTHTVEAEENGS